MVDEDAHQLDLTVSALKDGVSDLGLDGGLLEIDRWQERLEEADDPALQQIGIDLAELREHLEAPAPDSQAVAALLVRVGEQTLAAADTVENELVASRLRELGNLLTSEGEILAG